ncbi:MAG TPA: DUF1622 domain-containing protein [Croceibacterium sp.]
MEETFRTIASYAALLLESLVVLVVTYGSLEALYRIVTTGVLRRSSAAQRRAVWLRFAGWILLALEFALGADIVRTAIAPSWDDIGKLAAIAGIRTFLGFFLGRDLETLEETEAKPGEAPGGAA